MPVLTAEPTSSPPPHTLEDKDHSVPLQPLQLPTRWLSALRQSFRGPTPHPLQRTDAHVSRNAHQLLEDESARAPGCQGLTAEVEQGVVTLYGSVDTTWRKERLAALVLLLPGVKQVTNHLLVEEELSEQLERRFQSLLAAGKLESLPRFLVEHRMVELYGKVASPQRRSLVEREALAVPGVRVVLNHLRLPQEAHTPVHTTNR